MLGALFAFSLSMFAGNPGVTFLLRSGQKVSFAFAEKPVIALSDANLAVSVSGVERVRYAYADVQRVVVESDVVSAVNEVVSDSKNQHVVFTLSAGTLDVAGLAADEQISLYATDGKLVLSQKTNAEGKASVSLASLQQGVYVVRTQGGISYKLLEVNYEKTLYTFGSVDADLYGIFRAAEFLFLGKEWQCVYRTYFASRQFDL